MRKIKLGLIRGAFMKKLTTSILLALFSATIFTPAHVEASWLSKSWKKLEKVWNETSERNKASKGEPVETGSTSSGTIRLPQRSEYPSSYRGGRLIGYKMDGIEYQVLGVPMGATFRQIRNSLGEPSEINHGMRYGGVRFVMSFTKGDYDDDNVVDYIEITNRDATTHRGIAVGDRLEQVYSAYGRPTHIFDNNAWFYGTFMWNTDYISGIYFDNDGERVTKIHLNSH